MKKRIGILIFNEAEVLDFAGPFEVFSVSSELHNHQLFEVVTIAKEQSPVKAVNGLSVNPDYDFNNHPKLDILIISGGAGSRNEMQDLKTLRWIQKIEPHLEYLVSICSGSRFLGVLGYLDQQSYCTHHEVYEHMEMIVPTGKPQKDLRFTQAGKFLTSGGISAGIDMSFYMVEHLCGTKVATRTAQYMEYDWISKKN